MKTLHLRFLSLLLIGTSYNIYAAPPPLLLPEAAAIAQKQLDSLELPSEFFLRSIRLIEATGAERKISYEATFEPKGYQRLQLDTDAPKDRISKIIEISMDGSAIVLERRAPIRTSVIRKKIIE